MVRCGCGGIFLLRSSGNGPQGANVLEGAGWAEGNGCNHRIRHAGNVLLLLLFLYELRILRILLYDLLEVLNKYEAEIGLHFQVLDQETLSFFFLGF